MGWQYTPLVVPLAVATVVLLLVAAFVARQRWREIGPRVYGAQTVTAMLLASAFWTTTYALELLRTDLASTVLLNKVQYLGIAFLPLLMFVYVYHNVVDYRPLDRRLRVVLWGLPVVTVLLVFTNELHNLVWTTTALAQVGDLRLLVNGHGPWYFVFITYAYVLIFGLLGLLTREVVRSDGPYRRQSLVLLLGTACPAVTGLLYVLDANPIAPFNIAVFGFVPTSLALGWSVVRHQLFTLVPVARDRAVEQMTEGVLVVDERGRVIDLNPSAGSLLDCPVEDAVGHPLDSLSVPGLEGVVETLGTHTVETGGRYLDVTVSPLTDSRNHRVGRLILLRDVTNRAERKRRLERQNERLDEFASVVSHDLRNPLNVASGYLELARETGDPEHFERAEAAHDRMEELIEGLLVLARQGDAVTDTEPVSLADVAGRAWRHVETDGATLVSDADVDAAVVADDQRLEQLFENLFRNSVEHGGRPASSRSASGDSVAHDTTNARVESNGSADHDSTTTPGQSPIDLTITVGTLPNGFYVEDDGQGIDPEDGKTVFESGYSTNEDGTGFGLAIVEQVATAHGWSVDVTESADGGARFEVTDVDYVADSRNSE